MGETLYLFVTSERPDQYLNSMAHCLLYRSIRKVVFVHIKGLGNADEGENSLAERSISDIVLRNVQILLDSLATACEYRYFTGSEAGQRVSLGSIYPPEQVTSIKQFYKRCLDVEADWDLGKIDYPNLRKELARIRKDEPSSILDITSIKKHYLGDILAVSIVENIHQLYTFDPTTKPDFDHPWTMLIHDLQPDDAVIRQYQYVNIVDTPVFRDCFNAVLLQRDSATNRVNHEIQSSRDTAAALERRHRITLDPDVYTQIEAQAQQRGISPETLINLWLLERLQKAS